LITHTDLKIDDKMKKNNQKGIKVKKRKWEDDKKCKGLFFVIGD
jgi:hypothetical protein